MSLFVRRSHQSPLWLSLRSCSQKKEKKKVEPPKLDEPLGREIYRENQVVRLVLNSPKNRNALSLELMKTLREELSQIDKINKVRAVILAGEGPAFSAGHDLRQLTDENGFSKHVEIFSECTKLMSLIRAMQLPVIAEVNGIASAAGCQLVSTCDVVIASEESHFSVPGLKVGLFCSTPGIPLGRSINDKLAMDMLLTARSIKANAKLTLTKPTKRSRSGRPLGQRMVEKQAESPASSSTDPPSQIHQLSTNQRAETDPKNDAGTSESLPQNNTLPENRQLHNCTECNKPIRDRFLFKVLENSYHERCLKCADCQVNFQMSCYARNGRIFCRQHFFRRFGPKCSKCQEIVQENDVVRKANNHIYHLECFKCVVCEKELSTGDQFYLIPMDGRLVCRTDYENSTKEAEMDCSNKRPRTTISAKSLETLKQAYQASSKPARHIREQLAAETGLDMRVVQVWFQNRRAKEKRLKKDANRRWPSSANCSTQQLFSRTIDSDSGSNDESLVSRSPLYGSASFMENSSDLDMHPNDLQYDCQTASAAWTPLSRYPSEETGYMCANTDPQLSQSLMGMPHMMSHPAEHSMYGDVSPLPLPLPHSNMMGMGQQCGPHHGLPPMPTHHMPLMPHPGMPPYSH